MNSYYLDSMVWIHLENNPANWSFFAESLVPFSDYHIYDLMRNSTTSNSLITKRFELINSISNCAWMGYEKGVFAVQNYSPESRCKALARFGFMFWDDTFTEAVQLLLETEGFEKVTEMEKDLKISLHFSGKPLPSYLSERITIQQQSANPFPYLTVMYELLDGYTRDKSVQREVKRYSNNHLEIYNGEASLECINKHLISKTGKTFEELFIKRSESYKGKTLPNSYFLPIFFAFDVLEENGIFTENTKKFGTKNQHLDICHLVMSSHCSHFITQEKKLIKKSQVIFEFLGIETKIIDMDIFLN